MPFHLILDLGYHSDTEWRWALSDPAGRFLADHEVALDPADPVYPAFVDLPGRLDYFQEVRPAREVLDELGAWMGTRVFGAVGEALLAHARSPACVVQVRVPPQAQELLFRPFELAHLGGRPLVKRGVRLVYTVAHERPRPAGGAQPAGPTLRLLQYGATRELLAEVLQEAPGWDLIHFAGHGLEGELILETPDGRADRIDAAKLADLLRPAAERLKLLSLSACYSGAADLRAARAQVGLTTEPTRQAAPPTATSALPSLGQRLAEELDCAVLAMRYPVLDSSATELALTLYDRMLDKGQPLAPALHLALDEALHPRRDPHRPGFSRAIPLLFGARAAGRPPAGRLSGPAGGRGPGAGRGGGQLGGLFVAADRRARHPPLP